MKFSLPLTLGFTALTGVAPAVVVNFDFNLNHGDEFVAAETYTGFGAAPDSAGNTHWNSVRRSGSLSVSSGAAINSPILNSAGGSTTVNVSISNAAGGLENATIAHERATTGNHEMVAATEMMVDYLQVNAQAGGPIGKANGTIDGLVANGLYELYFYGQADDNSPTVGNRGQNSLFAITDTLGGTTIGTAEQTGWDGVVGGDGFLAEGVEYVKFTASADGLGQIFFSWSNVIAGDQAAIDAGLANVLSDLVPNGVNSGSPFGAFNGLQVVLVPEPSAALLGGLGVFGLLVRRRR